MSIFGREPAVIIGALATIAYGVYAYFWGGNVDQDLKVQEYIAGVALFVTSLLIRSQVSPAPKA